MTALLKPPSESPTTPTAGTLLGVLSKPEKPTIAGYFCKNYGRIEELVCDHYETVLEGAM
jgi:hypothetical protein